MHKVKNHHYITVGVTVFAVKIRIVYVRQFERWQRIRQTVTEWVECALCNRKPNAVMQKRQSTA